MTGWTTLVDATALAAASDVALFDCRFDLADPEAGARGFLAGHLPGAHYLHLDRDLSGPPDGRNGRHPLPDRDTLARRLAALGLRRHQPVVAYDEAGGAFAARLWWLLRWLGHEAVAVLDGGLPAWTAAGLPLVAGEAPPVAPGDFAAAPGAAMATATAGEILADLATGRHWRLVDARAPERFRGAPHPLDPAPGHVPGAANRFFRDNLGADGRFKPADALRADYRALLGDTPPERALFYCGSGVTAAHDLLAMAHAGLPGAALYPGSWSEWASDPARPVKRDR